MKKLLLALTSLFVLTFATNAQAKQTDKKAPAAKKEAAKPAPAAKPTLVAAPAKKDGTPDMRYKENKDKKAAAKPAGPLKKDGTPDKRYKENKKP